MERALQKSSSPQEAGGKKSAMAAHFQDTTGTDQQTVAMMAYALYEQRGREEGHALDDWLEAERRVVSRGEDRGF